MKRLSRWMLVTVAAVGLALAASGCKKETTEWQTAGTHVSLTELRGAFEDVTDKDIQTALNDALVSIRFGQYTTTLAALDKLANYSNASSSQKKVAAKVIGQVKAMAAKNQSATPAPER